jgi:hypothetical protein
MQRVCEVYSIHARLIGLTGCLLLVSACGVDSSPNSPKGFAMNASNQTMIAFRSGENGLAENKSAENPPKADTARGEADLDDTAGNPNATFKGCWYKSKKNRYQAVEIKVGNPGTYPFNALLYHGTTCNTNDYADQFGYGDPLGLGNGTYIFWFDAFKNDTNMSALWYLGDQMSKCMVYTATTPIC